MCPFRIGDFVRYRPTVAGRGHLVMTDLAKLERNAVYRIFEIIEDDYVVLEQFETAIPNAIHWTEFTPHKHGGAGG